jgi:hypothetical protein
MNDDVAQWENENNRLRRYDAAASGDARVEAALVAIAMRGLVAGGRKRRRGSRTERRLKRKDTPRERGSDERRHAEREDATAQPHESASPKRRQFGSPSRRLIGTATRPRSSGERLDRQAISIGTIPLSILCASAEKFRNGAWSKFFLRNFIGPTHCSVDNRARRETAEFRLPPPKGPRANPVASRTRLSRPNRSGF